MLRKAIALAEKTLVVSLPSIWVKQQNICKGDLLDICTTGSHLIVKKTADQKKTACTLDLEKAGLYSRRALIRLYENGFDEINLLFSSKEHMDYIIPAFQELLGFEIIQQRKSSAVVQDISNQSVEEYDKVFSRTLWLLKQVLEDLHEAVKQHNPQVLQGISQRDIQINKMCHVLMRLISKEKFSSPQERSQHTLLVWHLEYFGDAIKKFATLAAKNRQDKEIAEITADIAKLFESCRSLIAKPDELTLNESRKINDELREKIKKVKDSTIASYLSEAVDMLFQVQIVQMTAALGIHHD